jgi:hypothetical protein
MPLVSQIICDRCQAVKKETNHWYILVVTDREASIRPMALTPLNLLQPGAPVDVQYLCGRLCAIEALDTWMGTFTPSPALPNCVAVMDLSELTHRRGAEK